MPTNSFSIHTILSNCWPSDWPWPLQFNSHKILCTFLYHKLRGIGFSSTEDDDDQLPFETDKQTKKKTPSTKVDDLENP